LKSRCSFQLFQRQSSPSGVFFARLKKIVLLPALTILRLKGQYYEKIKKGLDTQYLGVPVESGEVPARVTSCPKPCSGKFI
jgi:hypothetical protein